MAEVQISETGRTLTFRRPYRDSDGMVLYDVDLRFDHARGEVGVRDWGEPGLEGFFAMLASRWQGFDGEERYESLEGNLVLCCTHNGVGRVTCDLTIGQPWPPQWHLRATLELEAGAQMQHVADELTEFFAAAKQI